MKLPATQFDLGAIVYAKVDPEKKGMVTGYVIRSNINIVYLVTWAEDMEEKECQSFELSSEKEFGSE